MYSGTDDGPQKANPVEPAIDMRVVGSASASHRHLCRHVILDSIVVQNCVLSHSLATWHPLLAFNAGWTSSRAPDRLRAR